MQHYTVAWEILQTKIPTALLSLEQRTHMDHSLGLLPLCGQLGLECRLAHEASNADISQRLNVNTIAYLGNCLRNEDPMAAGPAWKTLVQGWQKLSSTTLSGICDLWFEYDCQPNNRFDLTTPLVFIASFNTLEAPEQYWPNALGELAEILGPNYANCSDDLKMVDAAEYAGVYIAGLIPNREEPYRLRKLHSFDFKTKSSERYSISPAVLRQPETASLLDQLQPIVDADLKLSVDIGRAAKDERVGIELSWHNAGSVVSMQRFLDCLVENGLCSEEKRLALNQFPFTVTPLDTSLAWPDEWIVASMLAPKALFSTLVGFVHHYKLLLSVHKPPEVKAYLGFVEILNDNPA